MRVEDCPFVNGEAFGIAVCCHCLISTEPSVAEGSGDSATTGAATGVFGWNCVATTFGTTTMKAVTIAAPNTALAMSWRVRAVIKISDWVMQ